MSKIVHSVLSCPINCLVHMLTYCVVLFFPVANNALNSFEVQVLNAYPQHLPQCGTADAEISSPTPPTR